MTYEEDDIELDYDFLLDQIQENNENVYQKNPKTKIIHSFSLDLFYLIAQR